MTQDIQHLDRCLRGLEKLAKRGVGEAVAVAEQVAEIRKLHEPGARPNIDAYNKRAEAIAHGLNRVWYATQLQGLGEGDLDRAVAAEEAFADAYRVFTGGGNVYHLTGDEVPEGGEDDAFDAAWRREIAMEAGMLHGVDAYNDMMGY